MASFLRWWTNAEWLRLSTIDNDGRDCEIDEMLGNPFYKHVISEHQYPLQARKYGSVGVPDPRYVRSVTDCFSMSWLPMVVVE